jgi:peptidoglycan/LPS O-acetylase OafA/YrhL
MGVVRIFLAWVVACDHWFSGALAPLSVPIRDNFKFGFNAGYAVLFFYMISGFLITYALDRKYGSDTLAFYKSRFIRIFSLYWPMVILTFLLFDWSWTQFLAASPWDKLTGIFLLGQDWRMAFASYPDVHYDAAIFGLRQSWTLGAELTFYIAAPLLMRSWKIGAALLVASFGLRAAFVVVWGPALPGIWTYLFIGSTFGFFMLGHLAALAASRWPMLAGRKLGVGLTVGAFAAMTYGGSYTDFESFRFWLAVSLFTLALPGLFEATKSIRWMNWLGDLSYPVYLVHTLVMLAVASWWKSVGTSDVFVGYVSIACFVAASTLAALAVHRVLEIPAGHLMRRLIGYLMRMLIAGRQLARQLPG